MNNFGYNFEYIPPTPVLEPGIYTVRLGKPVFKDISGYSVLQFPFTVEGVRENVKPDCFNLFDCTDWTDKEKVAMFNKAASRIKDCFGLVGSFDYANVAGWEGSVGKVEIEKSKGGFTEVKKFLPK